MAETEKTIKGLECCIVSDPDDKRNCKDCPYNDHSITNAPCGNGLMANALALLKKQIPSIIDYNDLENYEVVWLEDVDKEEIIPAFIDEIVDDVLNKYVYFCVNDVNDVFAFKDEYNKRWRALSGRPSDKVRYKEPWIA